MSDDIRLNSTFGGKPAGYRCDVFLNIRIDGEQYRLHRIIWKMAHGRDPVDEVEFINLDKTDVRLVNLRECTRAQNQWNTAVPKTNTSGHKGVYYILSRADKDVARDCPAKRQAIHEDRAHFGGSRAAC